MSIRNKIIRNNRKPVFDTKQVSLDSTHSQHTPPYQCDENYKIVFLTGHFFNGFFFFLILSLEITSLIMLSDAIDFKVYLFIFVKNLRLCIKYQSKMFVSFLVELLKNTFNLFCRFLCSQFK